MRGGYLLLLCRPILTCVELVSRTSCNLSDDDASPTPVECDRNTQVQPRNVRRMGVTHHSRILTVLMSYNAISPHVSGLSSPLQTNKTLPSRVRYQSPRCSHFTAWCPDVLTYCISSIPRPDYAYGHDDSQLTSPHHRQTTTAGHVRY